MAELIKPDLCIIGAGAGGIAAARLARDAGASVVMIERGAPGGAQLRDGCLSVRALAAAAARAHLARNSARLGIGVQEPKINFARLHAHLATLREEVAAETSAERLEALGIRVITGHGRFIDRRRIAAGELVIQPRRSIIATGSVPVVPELPGLDAIGPLTIDTVMRPNHKPEHLVILGGGAMGLELAQAFLRFGSAVTLIDMLDPLGDEDTELAGIVLRRLEEEGLVIHGLTGVVAVRRNAGGIEVDLKSGPREWTLKASDFLIATGRRAAIDDLGLERAGVGVTSGVIGVDRNHRTTNRRVYAIGEVAGAPGYLQFAIAGGEQAARHATGLSLRRQDPVPRVTQTDPAIAHVGLTEAEMRDLHAQRYRVMRAPFGLNLRAGLEGRAEGLAKLVLDKKGIIYGASLVGPDAGELVSCLALAIAHRIPIADLERFHAPVPGYAGIIRDLACASRAPDQRSGRPFFAMISRLLR